MAIVEPRPCEWLCDHRRTFLQGGGSRELSEQPHRDARVLFCIWA
jgi:hypothetical protein